MKKTYLHLVAVSLLFSFAACKKDANNDPQPGTYSGQSLAISQTVNVSSPTIELTPDVVYSTYDLGSALVKPLPTDWEDKIISVFIPKGYQVVFAENRDGTGESVLFAATVSDLKANLPARLRNKVSYLRYTKINNPGKKGTCSTNDAVVQNFAADWYYGWSLNKGSFTNQQFVSMTWGKGSCTDANAKYLVERNDIDHLLSFNEPDNAGQSNIPVVDTAVQRYKIMMKTGLRLGSPVTTQDQASGAGRWLSNFMDMAQTQKARVDYIAVHWYDWGNETNNGTTDSLTAEKVFNRFVAYIQKVHTAYPDLPIWVTEYNANVNRTSQVVHKYFMRLSSEWMNTISYVERYSYFFPAPVPANNPDNSLTAAGLYWKGLPSAKAFVSNIIQDGILVVR